MDKAGIHSEKSVERNTLQHNFSESGIQGNCVKLTLNYLDYREETSTNLFTDGYLLSTQPILSS